MNWILGTTVVTIIIILIVSYLKKKKLANLKSLLIKNWGQRKEDENHNFMDIRKYFDNNCHKNSAYHIISEKSTQDLDLDEIFKFIDRTSSKVGQQFLYKKLRTIGTAEELLRFNSLIQIFENDTDLRINCQVLLSQLNSYKAYALEELIHGVQIQKPKIIWLVYLLSLFSILFVTLALFKPFFFILLIPIFFVNVFFHYKNKNYISHYLDAVNQLSISLKISKQLANFGEIKSYYKDLNFIKEVTKIKLKAQFIGFEKKLDNELFSIFWALIELVKIMFNIEYIIFYSFIGSIISKKAQIEQLFLFIGKIDAAISTASLRADDIQKCTPAFTTSKEITCKEIAHPLITDCVPNDFNIINKSILLTGSNMSGKTTFIRTVAINSILAQTLNLCFAKEYLAPFLKVYSSIRITDDLLEDTSYYLEEVLTIKKLITASQGDFPCLFVLDEIFKGTNTIERVSGGKAILSFLNSQNNIVLVSTHDIELTELLADKNYELFHFSEQIENEKLIFDHKLKVGKLRTRNAIKILELYKYPAEIIEDAKETEKKEFN